MIVAGIGCRKGVSAGEIGAAIDEALRQNGQSENSLTQISTPTEKAAEPGLASAAASRGIALIGVDQAALQSASDRTLSFSARAQEMFGVPSVAEAAALAAAGPDASLLAPRTVLGPVTCALASNEAEGT